MAAITVKCPECESSMKVAEESAGKKVRCKECEHVFVVKAPAAQSAARKDDKGAKAPAKGDKAKAITTKPADKDKGKPAAKPAAKAEAKKPDFDPDFDQDKDPYGMTEQALKARCPECANEMESEEAVVCLHCGFNTVTRERATKRKVQDVTGGDVFLWLLPGILCVLGIIITLVIMILYQLNAKKWYNEADWDWYNWLGHGVFQVWFWVMWCFATFYQGRFAVKRLLINNTPPEVEIK